MHQPSFGFRDLPVTGIAVDDGSTGGGSSDSSSSSSIGS
jgi:hypothetical protein